MSARITGDVTSDDAPSLDLNINIQVPRLTPKQLEALLPSPIFPSEFNRWILSSVKGGTVEDIDIRLKGL